MAPYTSMPMMMRANENNVIYSNNMEERKELIRRYLCFTENATNDELRSYNNIMEKASKPKSTVKRMVDYFKQNPIP